MRTSVTITLASFLLVVPPGCSKQNDAPPAPTATIENLKVAHAAEYKRAQWYLAAAVQAEQDRMGNLAHLFRALARSESVHAGMLEALLVSKGSTTDTSRGTNYPLGTTRQALKMALSLEASEYRGFFPPMQKAAEQEHWPEAAQKFGCMEQCDARHGVLLEEASNRQGTLPVRAYRVCVGCGYVTYGTEGTCPGCSSTTFETV